MCKLFWLFGQNDLTLQHLQGGCPQAALAPGQGKRGRASNHNAGIAQLVEHNLAKVGVAGPSPVFRSPNSGRRGQKRAAAVFLLCNDDAAMVELVDTRDLKSLGQKWPCGFESRSRHNPKLFYYEKLSCSHVNSVFTISTFVLLEQNGSHGRQFHRNPQSA